jgi:hypothetical protein
MKGGFHIVDQLVVATNIPYAKPKHPRILPNGRDLRNGGLGEDNDVIDV